MTREQEISDAAFEYIKSDAVKAGEEYSSFGDFIIGAQWADSHSWISVEDELPKINWTMSDVVVVTDGKGFGTAWYHQDEGWHFGTQLPFEPTHWMPLSLPIKKGGKE